MTRENKLALVVGFGLILFVGILVSDHFSTVRSQLPPNLTVGTTGIVDPLIASRGHDQNFIDLLTQQPDPPPPVIDAGAMAANNAGPHVEDPANQLQRNDIYPGELPGSRSGPTALEPPDGALAGGGNSTGDVPPGFKPAPPESPAIPIKFHDVRGGESLYAICRQYYGDASLVGALAKYNKMDDPASLRAGRRLVIPPAELIGGQTPAQSVPPASSTPSSPAPLRPGTPIKVMITRNVETTTSGAPAASSPATPTHGETAAASTYTVKPGDSLRQIALRILGSKTKWKKIHDLNKNVIDDPDNLKVGTVLRLL